MLWTSSCGFGHDSSRPVTLPQDPCRSFPVFLFLPYALHMFVISFYFLKLPRYISLCSRLSAMGFPVFKSQTFLINAFAEVLLLQEEAFLHVVSSTVR